MTFRVSPIPFTTSDPQMDTTTDSGFVAVQWEGSDDARGWHVARYQVQGGSIGCDDRGGWRRCRLEYNNGETEKLEAVTSSQVIRYLRDTKGEIVNLVQISP
jgi:hypothetical protein